MLKKDGHRGEFKIEKISVMENFTGYIKMSDFYQVLLPVHLPGTFTSTFATPSVEACLIHSVKKSFMFILIQLRA